MTTISPSNGTRSNQRNVVHEYRTTAMKSIMVFVIFPQQQSKQQQKMKANGKENNTRDSNEPYHT